MLGVHGNVCVNERERTGLNLRKICKRERERERESREGEREIGVIKKNLSQDM